MTRIQFQPEQRAISRSMSSDLSRQDRVSAEAFQTLLSLQLARYLQAQSAIGEEDSSSTSLWDRFLGSGSLGSLGAGGLFSLSEASDDGWALAASLFQVRAIRSATAAAGSGVHSAGIAAYKAQGMERFQQLKPYFLKAEEETGVPWQIQAAQWALETGWGRYIPRDVVTGRESHNLFGVKGVGPAGSVTAATVEYVNGQRVKTTAQFRAYHSEAESILEHARLLAGPRYAAALACGRDLKAWTEILGPQQLGYATDPDYAQKLWQIITENGWHETRA